MSANAKDSLNLPVTNFPMRASLAQREPERIRHWDSLDLYRAIQRKNAANTQPDGSPKRFVLHDGPPFTNGDIHMGHVLNKTLKDIILRYKSMRGYQTPYVLGWDCHGLPIEHAVTKELRSQSKGELGAVQIREACAAFAEKYIGIQGAQFKRLGVLSDPDRDYRTMNPAYEADILRTFARFVDQGLVYRSKKPVYWSIPCATALAEAEIEYHPHTSPSIWVRFPCHDPRLAGEGRLSVVIWTTTPWTLPANMAIAVHPRLNYVEVSHLGERLLVAEALAAKFIADCGLEGATLGRVHLGQTLEKVEARHPFIDRASPILLADYVTTEAGTGCVHTAPGHGLEDYQTGLAYGLDIYCPLDDRGCYVNDGQIPPNLVGVSVLELNGKCPANDSVLAILRDLNLLLKQKPLEHSYPHCWRSKTPVVFRAMDQWFVGLDRTLRETGKSARASVLEAIGTVKWIPSWGENRIRGSVESRPDWCVSRQRSWGVPLPCFYDADRAPFLDAAVIRAVADKVEQHGTNLWFSQTAAQLLEGVTLPAGWDAADLRPGSDTLDVWIDSGSSHRACLQRHPDLSWPADLYLEGSDQHRGWFQSSLWTAIIADGKAPFKNVLTHGFIVDEHGRKHSKSSGSKSATDLMNADGADILRLFVATSDYSGDVTFTNNIFTQVATTYRTIRNTLRYLLGNLAGFDAASQSVPVADMLPVDRWALHQAATYLREVTAAYEASEFHKVISLANTFCANTLSATYHDLLKDRLYTSGKTSAERRSAQTALHHIFSVLNRTLAPVLVFSSDEALAYLRTNGDFVPDSVHLHDWPEAPAAWSNEALAAEIDTLLGLRTELNEKLQTLRNAKRIGNGVDAFVTVKVAPGHPLAETLRRHAAHLSELFIVSLVTLEDGAEGLTLEAVPAAETGARKCPRCWRWYPASAWAPASDEEVCPRCAAALNS